MASDDDDDDDDDKAYWQPLQTQQRDTEHSKLNIDQSGGIISLTYVRWLLMF